MTRKHMVIIGACFGVAYAVSSAIRGEILAGIVTGVLGAVLVFLVLTRVAEHNAALRRRREREQG
jgi:L-lactate permease